MIQKVSIHDIMDTSFDESIVKDLTGTNSFILSNLIMINKKK